MSGTTEKTTNYQTYTIDLSDPIPSPPVSKKRNIRIIREMTSSSSEDDSEDVAAEEAVDEVDDTESDTDDSEFTGTTSTQQTYQAYIKTLSPEEQRRVAQLESEIAQFNQQSTAPLRYQILCLPIPVSYLAMLLQKLAQLELPEPNASERHILESWLKWPWSKYIEPPVNGPTEVARFLHESKTYMNGITYGQTHAKSKLLLELARYLETPQCRGFVLGLKGPPGCGKTTLINQGLSQLLRRPFYRFDLGGAKHSDLLFGSRKVFDRSDMGDLAKSIIAGKCLNPVFFFDELDKVSCSEYGMELIHGLNDITDQSRNTAIFDQYLQLPMDLSRAIIVFAYNHSEVIPETLRSRIHEIEIEPYDTAGKIAMCRQFFIPKSCRNLNFDIKQVDFTDEALKHVISHYCHNELGVRELERRIDEIILKLNWHRKTGNSDHTKNKKTHKNPKIEYNLTRKVVERLLSNSQLESVVL
jgi:ATP-dependent Lon protease